MVFCFSIYLEVKMDGKEDSPYRAYIHFVPVGSDLLVGS